MLPTQGFYVWWPYLGWLRVTSPIRKESAVPGEGRGIEETHSYRLLFWVGSEKNCLCKYITSYLHLHMFVSGNPFSPYHLMFISLKC